MARKSSKLYTNGVEEKYFTEGELIPEGFSLSKVFYINDGINNKRWTDKNNIPDGFVIGKLPLSRNWSEDQHKHHSEETKFKISKSRKEQGNHWEGKHHSENSKKKMSDSRKGIDPYNKGITLTEEEKIQRDQNIIEKYGSLEEFYKISNEKAKQTKLEKYGNPNYNNREKAKETCLENFGVAYYCMTDDFRKGHGNKSSYNDAFANLLKDYSIEFSKEFPVNSYLYDFKINNKLIEINPWVTHNSTVGVFNDPPKDKNYHINKLLEAHKNNYDCICLWSWDNPEKFIKSTLLHNNRLYARNCELKEVSLEETNNFLDNYHLQGTCLGQIIRLGLYYNNDLTSIMTFGKPRYNSKYEYELLRLCTKAEYSIIGGAEKLFKYFLETYSPKSIISYCDNAKFNGEVYKKLNFKLKSFGQPSKHWYNPKTNQHITDNLLRQRGFDQLFNEHYGKGTSNEQLMLEHSFVEIYDCGQSTYIY